MVLIVSMTTEDEVELKTNQKLLLQPSGRHVLQNFHMKELSPIQFLLILNSMPSY